MDSASSLFKQLVLKQFKDCSTNLWYIRSVYKYALHIIFSEPCVDRKRLGLIKWLIRSLQEGCWAC